MVLEEEGMGTWTLPVRGLEEKTREDVGWYTEGTLKTIFRLLTPIPQVSLEAPGRRCALNKRGGKASRDRSVSGWRGGQRPGFEVLPTSTSGVHGVGRVASKGWRLRGVVGAACS